MAGTASPSARSWWPSGLSLLAALAVGLAIFYYFTGEQATLPLRVVPHLAPVPLTLETVNVGLGTLPVQVSGFIVTLTHDTGGPFTQPLVAGLWLGLLAGALVGWLAVVSTLERPAFITGMVAVIFLLLSLNLDLLGVFDDTKQHFLILALVLLGGLAFGLHAFWEQVKLPVRGLLFGLLVAGLSALLFAKSQYSAQETALQIAAYATPAGAVLVGLLVLWLGVENIRALLWFNTQADEPGRRFGLVPFVLTSGLYLGMLGWWYWNDQQLALFPGLNFDPLVLLLPALLTAGLGLRLRAPAYAEVLPYRGGATVLFPLLVLAAAGALAYAFATANTPLLSAARDFTGLTFLVLGASFFLYILANFGPLIRQRLRVYLVVFEPRRMPLYAIYLLSVGILVAVEFRQNQLNLSRTQAGFYNNIGDLTRQQSEDQPDDLGLASLAERYYAESGDVLDRNNLHAQMGRAALYLFRQQRQNELNVLTRALQSSPSERVSLRLAARYNEPQDFFAGLQVLRQGLQQNPRSARLTNDLAQLYTRSALTDSVAFYLDKTERLAPGSYISRTNQLGFLLAQNLLDAAGKLPAGFPAKADEPALAANLALLRLLSPSKMATSGPLAAVTATATDLDAASFAALYHAALIVPASASKAWVTSLARFAERPNNADYYEQLLFLQALLRHRAGQEQAARQTLAPLVAGTSATAAYYQQLLGFWQLQQGQYATAADQLAVAMKHGATTAGVARASALALAGQLDSARAEATRAAISPDSTVRLAAQRLQQQLAVGTVAAWRRTAQAANVTVGTALLAQARQAESSDAAKAAHFYQQLLREAPFNEPAVLAAASFYTRRRTYAAAYEALHAGLAENPHAIALLQAYVLAAVDAGLADYATNALAQLQQQLSPAAFAVIKARFSARQAARAAAAASFSG